ncbi:MAG TPA: PLD nuclease N-terminal domain-containing protein [Cerasibacillus sp.]|uniref:PLD nuclease N-terminal domain-containing protein n=1 Tax=Cerasibacillus sp. TaxID=2498711 RepID=UPI002F41DBD4
MLDVLNQINWGIIAPLIVIQLILMVIALVDWSKREVTNGPKWLWLLIIIFVTTLGPILYFIFGRRDD